MRISAKDPNQELQLDFRFGFWRGLGLEYGKGLRLGYVLDETQQVNWSDGLGVQD